MTDDAGVPADGRRVRPARPADGGRIRELQSVLRRPSPELLAHGLALGNVLVSVASGTRGSDRDLESEWGSEPVVGYLLPVDGPDRPGRHVAELVVAPAYRRDGRGRELLSGAIDDADGPVTLQVHPDNGAALALYEAVGFVVVGRRHGFYGDDDALTLRYD